MSEYSPNMSRMFALIDEVFATRSDAGQLQVTESDLKKLNEIHPAALSELANENGPVIWVLVIPTTSSVMNDFLDGKIQEREIPERTIPGATYDCIYLCSATTLPEYRGKGETKKVCLNAINAICKDHPINTLFVWSFTKEGEMLAKSLAAESKLALRNRAVTQPH